jgi:hypothetical protein
MVLSVFARPRPDGVIDGLAHVRHRTGGSGFQQGIVEKSGAPRRGRSFETAWVQCRMGTAVRFLRLSADRTGGSLA